VRVVLANDYTGPGSGLEGAAVTPAHASTVGSSNGTGSTVPAPSPILTAGSENPECIN
ncbi:MAG: hypothetical protein QOG19_2167, partial [Mycobacterium sp.]|nr:hypothetical protein [Mycobacterium sp.]